MDYRNDLINNILPFWLENSIDSENGGIFTCIDKKGNTYGEEKSVWFQGRALWTFSKAYNVIEKDQRYIEAARTIYNFLDTGNDKAIEFGRKVIDATLPLGLDKEHGGLIAFTDVDKKPPVQLEWDMKLWWPQCETMIALRLAYILFGDEKYNDLYDEFKEYCEKYFCDTEDGEWYGYLHYDNTVSTTLKGNIFKGPFHVPRLYMIMSIMDQYNSIIKFFD